MTVRLKFIVWLIEPEAPETVRVYWPAAVPGVTGGVVEEELDPPHPTKTTMSIVIAKAPAT